MRRTLPVLLVAAAVGALGAVLVKRSPRAAATKPLPVASTPPAIPAGVSSADDGKVPVADTALHAAEVAAKLLDAKLEKLGAKELAIERGTSAGLDERVRDVLRATGRYTCSIDYSEGRMPDGSKPKVFRPDEPPGSTFTDIIASPATDRLTVEIDRDSVVVRLVREAGEPQVSARCRFRAR